MDKDFEFLLNCDVFWGTWFVSLPFVKYNIIWTQLFSNVVSMTSFSLDLIPSTLFNELYILDIVYLKHFLLSNY